MGTVVIALISKRPRGHARAPLPFARETFGAVHSRAAETHLSQEKAQRLHELASPHSLFGSSSDHQASFVQRTHLRALVRAHQMTELILVGQRLPMAAVTPWAPISRTSDASARAHTPLWTLD
jgi:hypothetical protein